MKIKPLVLISCLAAGALVASPAVGKPEKKPARKSTSASVSKSTRVVPRATQVTPKYRYKQNPSPRISGTRYDVRSHYSGARSYSGRQHGGTNYYYNGTRQYAANTYTVVPDTTMAVDLTPTTATTRVGRIRTGATARPGDITRTHTMAVTRTLITITTIPTTRQRTVIMYQWLPLCSVALGNSGITMAQSTESSDHGPVAPLRLLKAEMAWS